MIETEVELLPGTGSVVKNNELVIMAPNECPITGLPFETIGFRGKLYGILEEARSRGMRAIYVDLDLDDLKGLNEACGHVRANDGIRLFAEEKIKRLEQMTDRGLSSLYFYRPQAGGDEFKVLAIFDKSRPIEELVEEIDGKLREEVLFGYEEGKTKKLATSCGIMPSDLENEDIVGTFLTMQKQADEQLSIEKMDKIIALLKETIDFGRKSSIRDYAEEITRRWGSRRMTAKVLWTILNHFEGKIVAQILAGKIKSGIKQTMGKWEINRAA